jgi:hypothetical protein
MTTDRWSLLHLGMLIRVEKGNKFKNTPGVIFHEEQIRHGNGRLINEATQQSPH